MNDDKIIKVLTSESLIRFDDWINDKDGYLNPVFIGEFRHPDGDITAYCKLYDERKKASAKKPSSSTPTPPRCWSGWPPNAAKAKPPSSKPPCANWRRNKKAPRKAQGNPIRLSQGF